MDKKQYKKVEALFTEIKDLEELRSWIKYEGGISSLNIYSTCGQETIKLTPEAAEEIEALLRSRLEALKKKAEGLTVSGLEEEPQFIEL